jgi:hypothetical protein
MKPLIIPEERSELMRRMGDISQLAGVKRYELTDGKAKGVEAVDFRTGGGFNFTVLPGRGMDIAWADYKGVPISYMSKTGVAGPAYFEPEGLRWLRNFFAGLLTTCGLANAGVPCTDIEPLFGTEDFGLHGRISNMGADLVGVNEFWEGDRFVMKATGRMRESRVFGENLTLRREISAVMGENKLRIRDVIENEGFRSEPMMVLYHINLGYPLLDDGSRVVCNVAKTIGRSELSESELDQWGCIGPPVPGALERVYFHDPVPDAAGWTTAALINDKLELGAYMKFRKDQLSNLVQWKQLADAEYVLGLEPANCLPNGRVAQREQGDLEMLEPGQKKVVELEIGVLDGVEEININS